MQRDIEFDGGSSETHEGPRPELPSNLSSELKGLVGQPLDHALEVCSQAAKSEDLRSGNWEKALKPGDRLKLVAYGSLLSASSVSDTVSGAADHGKIVKIYGARLVMDFNLEEVDYARYPRSETDPERNNACLNMIWTGDPSDIVYGVVSEIPFDSHEDIDAFCQRERGYHLQPVPMESVDGPLDVGNMFLADQESGEWSKLLQKSNLYPSESYLLTCMRGALERDASGVFLRNWLSGIYLCDGKTRMIEDGFWDYFKDQYLPTTDAANVSQVITLLGL